MIIIVRSQVFLFNFVIAHKYTQLLCFSSTNEMAIPIAQTCIRLNIFDAVRHFYMSPSNFKTQSNPVRSRTPKTKPSSPTTAKKNWSVWPALYGQLQYVYVDLNKTIDKKSGLKAQEMPLQRAQEKLHSILFHLVRYWYGANYSNEQQIDCLNVARRRIEHNC